MKLETETRGTISAPTLGDVAQAVRSLDRSGNGFLILARSPTDYIQARLDEDDNVFHIEYHDPATDEHLAAEAPQPAARLIELLQDYRLGGARFRSELQWRSTPPAGTRKGCATRAATVVLAPGAVGALLADAVIRLVPR